MKYLVLNILCLFTTTVVTAQWHSEHELQFENGFEKNVFLNPETFITSEGQTLGPEVMWDNGLFQNVEIQNTVERDWKKGRLRLEADAGVGVYHTRESANRFHYDLGASYRSRFADRKYIEFAPAFSRLKRDGIDVSKAEIRQPFSYHRMELPVHLDFYLKKKWWLKTEFGGIIKVYDREIPGEKLRYGAPYGELSLSKKFEFGKHLLKITASSELEHRLFFERSLIEGGQGLESGPEVFESGDREWTYLLQLIEFKWYGPKKDFRVFFRPEHLSRIDRDVRLSYNQWAFKTGAGFEHRQWRASAWYAYRNRLYPHLSPGRGNDKALRYIYHMVSAKLYYHLNEKMQLSIHASMIERASNNPSETMIGFRGYETGLVELGFAMAF